MINSSFLYIACCMDKFYFNSETIEYKRIETTGNHRIFRFFTFMLLVIIIFAGVVAGAAPIVERC